MSRAPRSVAGIKRFFQHLSDQLVLCVRSPSKELHQVTLQDGQIAINQTRFGDSIAAFDQPEHVEINHARMIHLASLDLPINGRKVLDVGCGVGHLAQFFVERDCKVLCIDGREQNIANLRLRYPGLAAQRVDVEFDSLDRFGSFDVVFCYGLLYHLKNPLAALRNMASVCPELLLLETMVCDHAFPILRLENESDSFNQALKGVGCRPSPSYVAFALNRVGFSFIYRPNVPPKHQDFLFEWKNNLDWWRDGHPLRCVFVASRTELQNAHLVRIQDDCRA